MFDLLDEFEFKKGVGLYFLNLDENNEQIPTILFLTKNHIFRMNFNILDKQAQGYIDYRGDFEKIASTFSTELE